MRQQMTQRTSQSRRGRGPAQPLITKELERLRQKPPRAGKSVPLSNLDRLAILNGIRDGDAPTSCIRVRRADAEPERDVDNGPLRSPFNAFRMASQTATKTTSRDGRPPVSRRRISWGSETARRMPSTRWIYGHQ